jgi:hypothetical protein
MIAPFPGVTLNGLPLLVHHLLALLRQVLRVSTATKTEKMKKMKKIKKAQETVKNGSHQTPFTY